MTRAEAVREKVSENFQSLTRLHFLLRAKGKMAVKGVIFCISIFLASVPFFPGNLECLCIEEKREFSILGRNYSHPANSSTYIVNTAFFPQSSKANQMKKIPDFWSQVWEGQSAGHDLCGLLIHEIRLLCMNVHSLLPTSAT